MEVVKEEKKCIVTNVGNTFQKIANFALNVEDSSTKSVQIVKNRFLCMIFFCIHCGQRQEQLPKRPEVPSTNPEIPVKKQAAQKQYEEKVFTFDNPREFNETKKETINEWLQGHSVVIHSIRVETYLNRWKSRKWQESLRQVIIVYEPCEQYIPYLFGYVSTWSWPKFPQTKLDELYQQWLNDHSNYDILWKTQRSSQTMRNEYMASIFMLALQKKS